MLSRLMLLAVCAFSASCSQASGRYVFEGQEKHSRVAGEDVATPAKGYVNNPKTASEIAELVAKSIYGDAQIEAQLPYIVTNDGDHWIVRGSHVDRSKGGVFELTMSAADGRIISLTHGK